MALANYERQLYKHDGELNCSLLPWTSVILRNINGRGQLIKYKNVNQSKSGKPVWVLCKLHVFRNENQELIPVYGCDTCKKMSTISSWSLNQTSRSLNAKKCLHSKMADIVVRKLGDWRQLWDIDFTDLEDNDHSFEPRCNEDMQKVTIRDDTLFMACIFDKKMKKISILSTPTNQSKKPVCSNCSVKGCRCFRLYKKLVAEEVQGSDSDDSDVEPDFYWNRVKRKSDLPDNYETFFRHQEFGHNCTNILYPIKRDADLQRKFQNPHLIQFPQSFTPAFKIDKICEHNNTFDPSDDHLVRLGSEVKIYSENSERILGIPYYGRKSTGNCRCVQQADTHEYLLWNVGAGKFIEYSYLLNILHRWHTGLSITSQLNNRVKRFSNVSIVPSSLLINDLNKAFNGFCAMLTFEKSAWSCIDCSDTPQIIVADGQMVAPTSRKTAHLSELQKHPTDQNILSQGSKHKDRVFLNTKKERVLLKQLVKEEIRAEEFLAENIQSRNGQQVKVGLLIF